MSSQITREDLDDALYKAGIISQVIRSRLLYYIELYAHKYPVPEPVPVPVDDGDYQGYKYLCPACRARKYIGEFPSYKKINRRSPIPCTACQSEKPLTYRRNAATIRS